MNCLDCGVSLHVPKRGAQAIRCIRCRHKSYPKTYSFDCAACGVTAKSDRKDQRCCSPECARKLRTIETDRHERQCLICGITFKPKLRGGKFCSRSCTGKFNSARTKTFRTCLECGKSFPRRNGRCANKCCSQLCGWAYLRRLKPPTPKFSKVFPRQCIECLDVFVARNGNTEACSAVCRKERGARLRQQRHVEPVAIDLKCPECGSHFKATSTRQVYCSAKCSISVGRRSSKFRRKTVYVAARGRAEAICFANVWDRDGGRCYICDGLCFKSFQYPHPLAPTLDHRIPISLGGEHLMSNAGIAHNICNNFKGKLTNPAVYVNACKMAVRAASEGREPWYLHPLKQKQDAAA